MHSTRLTPWALLAAATAMAPLAAFAQTANPEAEPNETRANATAAASGGAGMASGDTITGTSTGAVTTAGAATSFDQFRVKTAAAPLGIYRHRLSLLSSTVGHTATIRGLSQSTSTTGNPGVINTTSDATAQTGSTTFPGAATGARVSQWYGFGRQEEIFYRVAGLGTTTGAYTATLDSQAITPTVVSTTMSAATPVVISRGAGNSADVDLWVYDSNFNPVANFGADGANQLSRTFTPGTYYVAWSTFNFANDQPAPTDETFRTSTVLDFPNAALNSSTTSQSNLNLRIASAAATADVTLSRSQFEVQWVQFTVADIPTPPTGITGVTPTTVDAGSSVLFTTTVTGGLQPASTGITVAADLSTIGGSATQAFFDDGTNGDVTAGDGIFSLAYTVPSSTFLGSYSLTVTVADAETRSSSHTVTLGVRGIPNAVNLGTISGTNPTLTDSRAMASGQILWYKFTVPAGGEADANRYIDIHTFGNTITASDTHIGLYRADGTLVTNGGTPAVNAVNDDWQSGLPAPNNRPSMLTFGQTSPGRVYVPGTTPAFTPADGRNGTLIAGDYYLAVSGFSATFGTTAFNVTTTHTRTGPSVVTILTNSTLPTNPVGTFVAAPSRAPQGLAFPTLITVNVAPGINPGSTGIAVTANLSSIGGSATQALFDDGTNGDVTAGDNIFSFAATVADTASLGANAIPFTVTDAQNRTSSGSGTFNVFAVQPLGVLNSATSPIVVNPTLAASQVQWYSFTTAADASPSIFYDFHTSGSALTTSNDTEIAIFNATTGALVNANDDATSLLSLLSYGQTAPTRDYGGGLTLAAGQTSATFPAGSYLIALAAFNTDFASGFSAVSASTNTGPARLSLVTNAPAPTLACNVADIVAIGGQPPADGILTGDDFNAFIGAFANGDLLADIVAIGGTPPGDGLITGDDFNAFIAAFAAGCP